MSFKSQLQPMLTQIGTLAAGNAAVRSVELDTGRGRLQCELTALDSIGCSFLQFAFESDELLNRTVDQLKAISETLSARLSYLLEPIKPLEIDRDACIVQLRSNPPQKDDDGTSYYELLAQPGRISLCRYIKPTGELRRLIPANVTREAFYRLAGDLASVV